MLLQLVQALLLFTHNHTFTHTHTCLLCFFYGFCVVPVWVLRSAYDHWPSGIASSRGSQLGIALDKVRSAQDGNVLTPCS